MPQVKLQVGIWIHGAAVWISSRLHRLQLFGGLFACLDSDLTEAHQFRQTGILLFQRAFDLFELLLIAESLLSELRVDNFICLSHLHRLVVLYHDLVEAVAKDPDLAHHWMVIVVHVFRDCGDFLGPLLQAIELLAFGSCFAFHVVELTPLNRKILLGVPLAFVVLLSFLNRQGLLLDLAFKNFVLLFQSVECHLIFCLLLFPSLHLL